MVGPFVKRFGERGGLFFGLITGVLAFAGFGLASRGWMMFAAIPFLALWGISGPATQSLMTRPHYTHECEKKGDRKWAIRKWLKRKNRILFGGSENT